MTRLVVTGVRRRLPVAPDGWRYWLGDDGCWRAMPTPGARLERRVDALEVHMAEGAIGCVYNLRALLGNRRRLREEYRRRFPTVPVAPYTHEQGAVHT